MKLSIVTTMYYSRNYLQEFYARTISVVKALDIPYEFIFVDDGSPDDSLLVTLQLQNTDTNIKVVELSRNYGHQRAIMTGLQQATGDYIYLIDCDLEEPPELLAQFWKIITEEKGVDVVYGVQIKRKGTWFEKLSGRLFYKIVSVLSSVEYPADTLTARIMNRVYVDSVLRFQEKELDLWSVFALVGFNQRAMPATKLYKGSTTYTFRKKLKLALEIITSFSHRPLYLTFVLGIFSFIVAAGNISYIVYKKMVLKTDVEGWTSIIASIWLVGGMILLVLGVFGIYLSKMFLEIKNRPMTIIKNVFVR
ncbi:MAG: glycosyltransferase family 2 protein [Bacteroidetes bacterium]|nr:glycosyltransferase family 2 protein [Bacteroidota bacterium]